MLQTLTMGHTQLFIHGNDVAAILELLVELMSIQMKRQVAHEDNLFNSAFESFRWSSTVTHVEVVGVVVILREIQSREFAGGEAADEESSGYSVNLRVMLHNLAAGIYVRLDYWVIPEKFIDWLVRASIS